MSNHSGKKTTDSLADVPPSILSKIKTQYAKLTELERLDKAALRYAADLASVIQQVVEDYGCKVAPLAKATGLDEREAQRLMKLPISSVLGEIKRGELVGADYRYPRWRSFVIETKGGGMRGAKGARGGKGKAATTEPTERIDDAEAEGFKLQRIVDVDPQTLFEYLCVEKGFSDFIPYLADYLGCEEKQIMSLYSEMCMHDEDVTTEDLARWYPGLVAELVIEAEADNETVQQYLGRPLPEVKELMEVLRDTTITVDDLADILDRYAEAAVFGMEPKPWSELAEDNNAARDRIAELEAENASLQERLKNSRHGPYSRGNQEVGTPIEITDQVKQEFGNDIQDVAASDELHIFDDYLTIKEDGLTAKWKKIAYCCPPFGDIGTWMYRGLEHWMDGGTFIALVPLHCDSNTDWFWDVAQECRVLGYFLTVRDLRS